MTATSFAVIGAFVLGTAVAPVERRAPQAGNDIVQLARDVALATAGLRHTATNPQGAGQLKTNLARATQALTARGDEARGVLEKVLTERHNYVTMCAAAYGLFVVAPSRVATAVEALHAQMNRAMFSNQALAQDLILAIGAPGVPTLTKHLHDSMTVQLLGRMGPAAKEAVPALRERLGTSNVEVAATLARIATDDAVTAALPVLTAAARDTNGSQTQSAVIALGGLGARAKAAAPAVREALNARAPETRLYAAIALADLGDVPAAVDALARQAADKDLDQRHLALKKLTTLGPRARAAVPNLIAVLLDDSDPRVVDRALAATALSTIDPQNPAVTSAIQKASAQPELRSQLLRQGLIR